MNGQYSVKPSLARICYTVYMNVYFEVSFFITNKKPSKTVKSGNTILRKDDAVKVGKCRHQYPGWYFPLKPTNIVRRKFLKSQEILKNMH